MWWDGKITRTFRCRIVQKPGSLGRLLAAVGEEGGLIGEIRIVTMGSTAMVRDITVYADDIRHLDRLIRLIQGLPDVELLEVRDEVLEMHQGGKIAIRSRYDISSLATLRRVYTPGVAEVSLKIKDDPSLARRLPPSAIWSPS
jgi:malate dehydrogenase (oxaloacetate-decarboxylating)